MNSADILHHITVAGKPKELVQTVDGQIAYEHWLLREKRRIERKSDWPVAIYTNPKTHEVSLVHLRVKS